MVLKMTTAQEVKVWHKHVLQPPLLFTICLSHLKFASKRKIYCSAILALASQELGHCRPDTLKSSQSILNEIWRSFESLDLGSSNNILICNGCSNATLFRAGSLLLRANSDLFEQEVVGRDFWYILRSDIKYLSSTVSLLCQLHHDVKLAQASRCLCGHLLTFVFLFFLN